MPPALRCGWFPATRRTSRSPPPPTSRGQGHRKAPWTSGPATASTCTPSAPATASPAGVLIPFGRGLVGHSDADVGLHALTDAVLGALGEGDIGQWFPPTDPTWARRGLDYLPRRAAERAAERGFAISHLDVTLICEAPKVGPHAAAMRSAVARAAGVDPERVSVKATTSERLGFTGRGEGIALATATLVRP